MSPCNGLGVAECLCGGDSCHCPNRGTVDCLGCNACQNLGPWMDECEAQCGCCKTCQPGFCEGVAAGGICDQTCHCEKEES